MTIETVQTNPAIGERGQIDIHRPDTSVPTPFVLAVHGGGWSKGDRHSFDWVAQRLLPHGLAVVTCSYRTCKEAHFPAAYDDLVTLLKWLRLHAHEHGLSRCALLGSSAGGHLVSLLASRATQEHRSQIIDLHGVVDYCPPIDLILQHTWDLQQNRTMTVDFMGGTPEQIPAAYHDANPLRHAHRDMPPVWLIHGDQDMIVPIAQSQQFAQRLASLGVDCEFHVATGRGHTMVPDLSADYVLLEEAKVIAFLKKCLLSTHDRQ